MCLSLCRTGHWNMIKIIQFSRVTIWTRPICIFPPWRILLSSFWLALSWVSIEYIQFSPPQRESPNNNWIGIFHRFIGMQNQFTPEQLGVISSSALAYSIFELIIYSITLYVSNISTSIKTLDLLAFSGYKFVTINLCIIVSIVFKRFGYYLTLLYTSITLCFFLVSKTHHSQCEFTYFLVIHRMRFVISIFFFSISAAHVKSENSTGGNDHSRLWCVRKCSTSRCSCWLLDWTQT